MPPLTHGLTGTPVFFVWQNMIQRCGNPKNPRFPNYGGRGIKVCERWRTLANFVADMGHPPPGRSIERRDNDGDYQPDNCYWATALEQNRNTRRVRRITFGGETMLVTDWAKRIGITRSQLCQRLRRMSVEAALSTPADLEQQARRLGRQCTTKA